MIAVAQKLSVGALLAWSLVAAAGPVNDGQAQDLVNQIVKRDGLYTMKPHCVQVVGEASEKKFVQFVVREKSGDGCPGKGAAAGAVLDRFRVIRASGAVKWQTSEGGKFKPYAKAGKAS